MEYVNFLKLSDEQYGSEATYISDTLPNDELPNGGGAPSPFSARCYQADPGFGTIAANKALYLYPQYQRKKAFRNIYFNSEENSIAMSMLNGDYDLAQVPADFTEMLTTKGLVTTQDLNKSITYICFNTKDHRPVSDPNLRKAIAAAIDYKQLMDVLKGEGFWTDDLCPMDKSIAYWKNPADHMD